ncbi:SDR family NAD(P)-dependent oxidoreductase [Aestuariivirga sp.]|uniref:SDR family NAD(P)-dependent oxidoreductase n=1 Tax=Aestuariivirga sp. TaxID=2650926 RepID=UPI003BAA30DD
MDLGLKGLNVLVTGGTKGIGRRAANMFAEEGANVSVCARSAADVNDTVSALSGKGVRSFGRAIDVRNKAELEGWVHESGKALGGIDIVIANVSALAAAEDTEESWQAEFEIDMMHTVRTVNAALPHLEKSKWPSIVIVSSVSGREIDFTSPAYGAFKAALIHYAHGLAHKLAPKLIRVNSVSPGNVYFADGIWHYIEKNIPDLFKQALSLNPTGRMATAEEIGKGIVFLASPASSFTMGTNLVIDGALTKGVQF